MNLYSLKIFFLLIMTVCSFREVVNSQDTLTKYILTPKAGPQPKINGANEIRKNWQYTVFAATAPAATSHHLG